MVGASSGWEADKVIKMQSNGLGVTEDSSASVVVGKVPLSNQRSNSVVKHAQKCVSPNAPS